MIKKFILDNKLDATEIDLLKYYMMQHLEQVVGAGIMLAKIEMSPHLKKKE